MVEHRLPKPGVEGSNPFSRSNMKSERSEPEICVLVECSIREERAQRA